MNRGMPGIVDCANKAVDTGGCLAASYHVTDRGRGKQREDRHHAKADDEFGQGESVAL